MKVLVTGGAGFIGSNLIQFLIDKKYRWDGPFVKSVCMISYRYTDISHNFRDPDYDSEEESYNSINNNNKNFQYIILMLSSIVILSIIFITIKIKRNNNKIYNLASVINEDEEITEMSNMI